jgi:hypothetical protein
MAQKTVIQLTDDLDGGEATQTIAFGFKGTTYEIDLNDEHAETLAQVLEPWIEAARATGAPRTSSKAKPSSSATGVALNAVREWAAANGIDVAARGRIAAEVIEKFRAAGN